MNNINLPARCPKCRNKLVYAPDGRGRICERCGYREVVSHAFPAAAELGRAQRLLSQAANRADHQKLTTLRLTFQQGIGALKAGERDEAYSHLQRVIMSGDADDRMRAEAWLYLSQLYEDPADKRECLEQVLAFDPTHGLARRGLAVLDGRLRPDEIVDPNQIRPPTPAEPVTAQATQFTCPQCGGRMNYTPDGTVLRCEFCAHEQGLTAPETAVPSEYGIGGLEQDFITGMARAAGHISPIATRLLQCQGCGVEFMLAPETLSLTCPYCDHVYVTETAETRDILPPQALIPFAYDIDQAKNALRDWFRQQKISRVRLSSLIGIYLPIWTFDLSGEITWKGYIQRGNDWVPTSGSGHVMEDDYLVPAQQRPSRHLQQSLTDFHLDKLVPYDPRYLADWPAERYKLTMSDASLLARKAILHNLRRRPDILTHGDYIRDLTLNSSGLMVISYKLILLPMWTAHYTLEEKTGDLYINGQTGTVHGDRPEGIVGQVWSWLKGGGNG